MPDHPLRIFCGSNAYVRACQSAPPAQDGREGRRLAAMTRVDEYADGLERWQGEFAAMRPILASAGLAEDFKWRKPCFTHDGRNIVIFQPFNELCALMFFKGALLSDPKGMLREQGEHSRSALRL